MTNDAAAHPIWACDDKAIKAEYQRALDEAKKWQDWHARADSEAERFLFRAEKAEARATRAEGERDEAIKARNAMSHGFDELQEGYATLHDKIGSLEEDVAEFSAEARVAKDERDAVKEALDGLIDAATSIVFPDGDHGAEQSQLAKALTRARIAEEERK